MNTKPKQLPYKIQKQMTSEFFCLRYQKNKAMRKETASMLGTLLRKENL